MSCNVQRIAMPQRNAVVTSDRSLIKNSVYFRDFILKSNDKQVYCARFIDFKIVLRVGFKFSTKLMSSLIYWTKKIIFRNCIDTFFTINVT